MKHARRVVLASLLPGVAALACIAAFAGLLGLGRWQDDEYILFTNQARWGWHILLPRLSYSPRPFSEGVLFLYGEAVSRLDRPLVASFLAVLWAGMLVASFLAARVALPAMRGRAVLAAVFALMPFAALLAAAPVTELFFWPMSAAAYLPTVAAAPVLLFLLSGPLTVWRRLAAGAALAVAAGSSEMGAALALAFAGCAVLAWRRALRRTLAEGWWWIVPGLLGATVLAVIVGVRAGLEEMGASAQPYTGQAAASLAAAVRALALQFVTRGAEAQPVPIVAGVVGRLLLALGLAGLWRQVGGVQRGANRWLVVLALSLVAAAFFSLATAYFHYGTLCCERQQVTRDGYFDVVAVIAALLLLQGWQRRLLPGWLRSPGLPAVLLVASLFPVLPRLDNLRVGYENLPWAVLARSQGWHSGRDPRTDWMQFRLPPTRLDMPVRSIGLEVGSYAVDPLERGLVNAIGRYFNKRSLTVCQPWQTSLPWVIGGIVIPACPSGPEAPAAMPPVSR